MRRLEARMKTAYNEQKSNARKRGIGWGFNYAQWVAWWEGQLGDDWFELRGCRHGQYVMARFEDEGDYTPTNVKCTLVGDNHTEWNTGKGRTRPRASSRRSHLTPRIVTDVFLDEGGPTKLSKKYNITKQQVYVIRYRHAYRNVTDELVRC